MKLAALLTLAFSILVHAQPQPGALAPPPRYFPPQQGDSARTLPENYVLTLITSDKDKVVSELAIVVAASDFNTTVPDMTFSGTLTLEEGGSFILRYALAAASGGGDKSSFKSGPAANCTASVRLRLGESLPILKADGRSFKLTITRLTEKR